MICTPIGRNVDLSQLDVPVIMGKPIHRQLYRGIGGSGLDGLYLVGLHAMQHVPGALLAHSYLKEYDAIYINGQLVGEIGVEALLAGRAGVSRCVLFPATIWGVQKPRHWCQKWWFCPRKTLIERCSGTVPTTASYGSPAARGGVQSCQHRDKSPYRFRSMGNPHRFFRLCISRRDA